MTPADGHEPITALSDARDRLSEPFEGDALHRALIELARSTDKALRLGKRSDRMEVSKGPGFRAAEAAAEPPSSPLEAEEDEPSVPPPIFAGPYELLWQVPGTTADG